MDNKTAEVFGLFELNTAGMVLYSRIDAQDSSIGSQTNLIGLNFFDEVAVYEAASELRRRFRYFANGNDPAEKFTLTYLSEQEPVEVKVLLTQISHREYNEKEKLIILDIRKIS